MRYIIIRSNINFVLTVDSYNVRHEGINNIEHFRRYNWYVSELPFKWFNHIEDKLK